MDTIPEVGRPPALPGCEPYFPGPIVPRARRCKTGPGLRRDGNKALLVAVSSGACRPPGSPRALTNRGRDAAPHPDQSICWLSYSSSSACPCLIEITQRLLL